MNQKLTKHKVNNKVKNKEPSYVEAWKQYIAGSIPSRHAHRIIVQFVAACCGKSKTVDVYEEETAGEQDRTYPNRDVELEELHRLIDLGAQREAGNMERQTGGKNKEYT